MSRQKSDKFWKKRFYETILGCIAAHSHDRVIQFSSDKENKQTFQSLVLQERGSKEHGP